MLVILVTSVGLQKCSKLFLGYGLNMRLLERFNGKWAVGIRGEYRGDTQVGTTTKYAQKNALVPKTCVSYVQN